MQVNLIHHTPLWVCSKAIRKCWSSEDKSDSFSVKYDMLDRDNHGAIYEETIKTYCGEADKTLIERVGNKNKHSSTLEHLNYNFEIKGISHALLQELARHRHASLSVKSTRYTLKELAKEKNILESIDDDTIAINKTIVSKFCVDTNNEDVDDSTGLALAKLQEMIKNGVSNDVAKYCLPEAYKTELMWTINARSLQNFLMLRTNKAALWEIRKLAYEVFNQLPEEHKYLFTDSLYKENKDVSKLCKNCIHQINQDCIIFDIGYSTDKEFGCTLFKVDYEDECKT